MKLLLLSKGNEYEIALANDHWKAVKSVPVDWQDGEPETFRTLGKLYLAKGLDSIGRVSKGGEIVAFIQPDRIEIIGNEILGGEIALDFWKALQAINY